MSFRTNYDVLAKNQKFWNLEKLENLMNKVFFREKNVFIFWKAFFTKMGKG